MKYRKFQYNHNFYGGIVTAYCTPCNLNCVFCFSQKTRDTGKDLTPEEVVDKLLKICEDREEYQCRISGGEVLLDFDHALSVIELLLHTNQNTTFLLETNGMILGCYPELVQDIKKISDQYPNRLTVRVSLKHIVPEWFSKLTNAPKEDVELPLAAIEELVENQIPIKIGIMTDWYGSDDMFQILEWMYDLGLVPHPDDVGESKFYELADEILCAEEFRKYQSVPMSKKEIWEMLLNTSP